MSIRGVGIDNADIRRITRLVESHGDRFTRRWFTAEETAQCQASPAPARAYAVRFAAKEAVWKALGIEGWTREVPWRWIAVVYRGTPGTAGVQLSGPVADAADELGITAIRVSTSTYGDVASAVAVAERALPVADLGDR